jgi:hypothetical protein
MSRESPGTWTRLLEDIGRGEAGAADQLVQLLGVELYELAKGALRHERAGHTLSTTDLVHEVLLRLMKDNVWDRAENRAYLFGAVSRALCQILVDYARSAMRAPANTSRPWTCYGRREKITPAGGRRVAEKGRKDVDRVHGLRIGCSRGVPPYTLSFLFPAARNTCGRSVPAGAESEEWAIQEALRGLLGSPPCIPVVAGHLESLTSAVWPRKLLPG